jgi:hypothetical protein
MNYDNGFILQKTVDWSLLHAGMTLPVSLMKLFGDWDASTIVHGSKKKIKVLLNNKMYDAILTNVNFKKDEYGNHRDVLQIRYSPTSELARVLREIFHTSFSYYEKERELRGDSKKLIPQPTEFHEYIKLYFTSSSDILAFECYTDVDYQQLANMLSTIPEEVYESTDDDHFFMTDDSASIQQRERLVKYRKIDRSIIQHLKKFYNYCDEISGEKIGDEFGESVVEAHHIDYFTHSQNNDSTNIIIISPNYHRIIHKNNPRFNRNKFQFEFENGEVLRLKLYEHLKTG